jgi:homoserine kinase type II
VAVFTPVTVEEAQAHLRLYDGLGDVVSLTGVAEGVENTNFRLETTTGVYALTLFEKRVDPDALPFYLGMMEHLAARGAPAPAPQRMRSGEVIGVLNARAAAIVQWLPGAWLRTPGLSDQRTAGRMLAEMHRAIRDFPMTRPNALGPSSWRELIDVCAFRAKGDDAVFLSQIEAEYAELLAAWPRTLPSGVVHADYFPDNVLFSDGKITGVIDYYFACTDFFAYDLAIALNAWGFKPDGSPDAAALSAFLAGYESVRPLSPEEAQALPILCRGSAVRFTLTRLHDLLYHDPSWLVTPKDPRPFFRRVAFHRGCKDADSYRRAAAEAALAGA